MQPNKKQLAEVGMIFADCLALIYTEAGLDYPKEFCPEIEAARIIAALRGEK